MTLLELPLTEVGEEEEEHSVVEASEVMVVFGLVSIGFATLTQLVSEDAETETQTAIGMKTRYSGKGGLTRPNTRVAAVAELKPPAQCQLESRHATPYTWLV